jgi:hypothetical protein
MSRSRIIVAAVSSAAIVLPVMLASAKDLRPPARPGTPPPSYFDLGPPPPPEGGDPPGYVDMSLQAGEHALDGTMAGPMDEDFPSSFGVDRD